MHSMMKRSIIPIKFWHNKDKYVSTHNEKNGAWDYINALLHKVKENHYEKTLVYAYHKIVECRTGFY